LHTSPLTFLQFFYISKRTFFDDVRSWPFFNQVTVGVGDPVIGTVIVSVSPTVSCILRLAAGRHTAGLAKIQQLTLNFQLYITR